jgi:hypothetical protein
MLKLFGTTILAAALSVSSAYAAPVSGYGDTLDSQFASLYAATLAACGPAGDADACAAAINAYSAALVSGGVPLEIATASFQELRDDVRAAGGNAAIDAVFEQLLPETESIGQDASPS